MPAKGVRVGRLAHPIKKRNPPCYDLRSPCIRSDSSRPYKQWCPANNIDSPSSVQLTTYHLQLTTTSKAASSSPPHTHSLSCGRNIYRYQQTFHYGHRHSKPHCACRPYTPQKPPSSPFDL